MNDAALVGLALTNPQQGVAAIYDRYGTSLFNYCYSILRSQADAGDALQESFVTVMGKLSQLRDPEKLRPWLYAIARNQCFKQHRQRTRERPEDPFETGEEQTVAASTAEPVGPTELVALVWEATAGLSDVDRSVLELNIRHELDGEELAESLGVPGPKCSVILHRAKDRLKTAVGALIVSKVGADACDDLAGIVAGHEFSPLVRKRVARHITGCGVCEETERRHRPEAYLAAAPLLPVPASLHKSVLDAIQKGTATTADANGYVGEPRPGRFRPQHERRHHQRITEQHPDTTNSTSERSCRDRWEPIKPSGTTPGSPCCQMSTTQQRQGPSDRRVAAVAVGCVVVAAVLLMLLNPFRRETTIIAGAGPVAEATDTTVATVLADCSGPAANRCGCTCGGANARTRQPGRGPTHAYAHRCASANLAAPATTAATYHRSSNGDRSSRPARRPPLPRSHRHQHRPRSQQRHPRRHRLLLPPRPFLPRQHRVRWWLTSRRPRCCPSPSRAVIHSDSP